MLETLKKAVCEANLAVWKSGLVTLTWGNVSGIDRESGLIVIKPSGVSYETMQPEDMVVVDLSGNRVEGNYRPSSDTPTHLVLYKAFPKIGGIVHTHSPWATIFAQEGRSVPALGTTHADHFYGSVPCTRRLRTEETGDCYEADTGRVIVETFSGRDENAVPAVLVHSHGPFTWGPSVQKAVENAVALESVCMMAWHTLQTVPDAVLQQDLTDRHYYRKHGPNAYYGQEETK